MTPNSIRGVPLFDISESNLSEDFIKKIKAISSIIDEVLADRKAAKAFSENPNIYLVSKEETLQIVLTEEDKNVLKAFSDKDIVKAVKNNDMAEFLKIGKERGYLGVVTGRSADEIRAIFRTEEDYNEFVMGLNDVGGPGTRAVGVGLFVVAVAGAAVYVAVETMAAIQVGVVYHVGFWTETAGPSGESNTRNALVVDREPALRVWSDNNGSIASDAFYKEIIESQVDSIFNIVSENYKDIDEVMLKSIIKSNLEAYYGLKKTK